MGYSTPEDGRFDFFCCCRSVQKAHIHQFLNLCAQNYNLDTNHRINQVQIHTAAAVWVRWTSVSASDPLVSRNKLGPFSRASYSMSKAPNMAINLSYGKVVGPNKRWDTCSYKSRSVLFQMGDEDLIRHYLRNSTCPRFPCSTPSFTISSTLVRTTSKHFDIRLGWIRRGQKWCDEDEFW